ncbi:MAG: hypothetical protein ABI746_12740 [Dermatophilaceae bacterium]
MRTGENAQRAEVSRFCQRQGIGRSVFYKIRRQGPRAGPGRCDRAGVTTAAEQPGRTDPKVIEHALAVWAWLVARDTCNPPRPTSRSQLSQYAPAGQRAAEHAVGFIIVEVLTERFLVVPNPEGLDPHIRVTPSGESLLPPQVRRTAYARRVCPNQHPRA